MNNVVILGFVRHLLTLAGTALASQGHISEPDVQSGVGALITIGGIVWSVLHNRKVKRELQSR